ncbi:MAG: protein-glutamate O-methyltransferase CheR [Armatimonadota bacterium]|nr:protein-glutamate O-methyltransferase CheR [bacterium]
MSAGSIDQLAELDFASFKRKVKAAYSLDLDAYKRPQMERRLRANMERCGAATFQQYYAFMQADPKLRDEFLDRVTINVSELFRNPEQFETLRTRVLPELFGEKKDLSVWSAGCSYGAEPYTLSVLLDEAAPTARHTILATDIDDKMLARAQKGIFQESEMRGVSKARLTKYFDITPEGYVAKDVLKRPMRFRKHNMLEDRFQTGFDLILCRNVVIYFTDETKSALYQRFYDSLRPGGFLFVGGTERIADYKEIGFESTISFFYRKPYRN